MSLSSAQLRPWVLQRLQERDCYVRDGNFMGKSALKVKLGDERPKFREQIGQIISSLRGDHDYPSSWHKLSKWKTPNSIPNSSPSIGGSSNENESTKRGYGREQGRLSRRPQNGNAPSNLPPTGPSEMNQSITGLELVRTDPSNSREVPTPSPLSIEELHDRFSHVPINTGKETQPIQESSQKTSGNTKILALQKFLNESKPQEETTHFDFDTILSTARLQLQLLHLDENASDEVDKGANKEAVKNSVLFSDETRQNYKAQLPQYGLLGTFDSSGGGRPELFLNTNIPFSAFVCGIQGSGKSHTSTCMIENCLIQTSVLGSLEKPLTALVFNFAEYTTEFAFRPSEAVFLAAPSQSLKTPFRARKVKVLVSPSNYRTLGAAYSQIPGVSVEPFKLQSKDLNVGIMLTLMGIDQSQGSPLYMGTVTKILRRMAMDLSEDFNYLEFRRRLDEAGLDRNQMVFLEQRLDLLESFLDLEGSTSSPTFEPGEVTIMDLSCPFVDASTACVLFKIGMGMFLGSDAASGKVIFVDEAHKFMTETPGAKALTESLKRVIKEQRHYGARVIISTQEPTISPKLIDLCSITVIHRFTSPDWLSVLRRHISLPGKEPDDGNGQGGLYKQIVGLRTGEALVFAPSAVMGTIDGCEEAVPFRLLRVKVRRRITWDGGISMVSV